MSAFVPAFQTRPLLLDVEGLAVQLSVITNTAELIDELIAKGSEHEDVQDERIPYWADLWPSALALSRHLVRSGIVQPGMQVTEMGCGLGLPGIVAGLLGAETTLTDYLPDALRFAHRNWGQNLSRPARFELMDWRQPDPGLAADLLLASDVAYESRAFSFLPQAFRTLCRPGGTILLSEPNRAVASGFLAGLEAEGFQVASYPYKGVFEQYTYQVNVYALKQTEFPPYLPPSSAGTI
jgi:predicted nicotinamide N-methyase